MHLLQNHASWYQLPGFQPPVQLKSTALFTETCFAHSPNNEAKKSQFTCGPLSSTQCSSLES
jgi:hypothetical protein